MKLTTLLEYQRCYDILRRAEAEQRQLTSKEYMEALRASSVFDFELLEHTKPITMEIT